MGLAGLLIGQSFHTLCCLIHHPYSVNYQVTTTIGCTPSTSPVILPPYPHSHLAFQSHPIPSSPASALGILPRFFPRGNPINQPQSSNSSTDPAQDPRCRLHPRSPSPPPLVLDTSTQLIFRASTPFLPSSPSPPALPRRSDRCFIIDSRVAT